MIGELMEKAVQLQLDLIQSEAATPPKAHVVDLAAARAQKAQQSLSPLYQGIRASIQHITFRTRRREPEDSAFG